jgi:hypothetical protein
MTETMYTTVLEKAECKKSKDGTAELPEGRTLTLYVAHDGSSMSVSRLTSLRLGQGGIIEARDAKGELYLVSIEDVYAASISGGGSKTGLSRKAGFISQ